MLFANLAFAAALGLSASPEPAPPTTLGAVPVTTVTVPTLAVVDSTTTGCSSVAHIGDSLSVPLTSASYLPDPADRLEAQYGNVGVSTVVADNTGGRSIVETVAGNPNAETGMYRLIAEGYGGCWVLAMGTNDAANYAVGSNYGHRARIDLLMAAAGSDPTLWITVKTQRSTGPYADIEMQGWNAALVAACGRYPHLRIYDWAGEVEDGWFQDDGIHFTSYGYAERARRTAAALANVFPADGRATDCVVTS